MDQVEEVRSKIDIVQFISEYLPLKRAGRNLKALCPFHSEKTPSFIVSPERQMWKCFGCFPAGQLIKTRTGIRFIEDIRRGDEVFTHKGRWQKVTRLLERDYNGDLISIRVRKLGGEVTLTGDHRVFAIKTKKCGVKGRNTRLCQSRCKKECSKKYHTHYKVGVIQARELSLGDYLLYPINSSVDNIKIIDLKKYQTKLPPQHGKNPRNIKYQVKIEEDFLKLVGYWIAEGSNHRAYIRFSLGNDEEGLAKEIQRIIKRLFGLETSIYRRKSSYKTGLELTCCHSFLANIFANLCGKGAENKQIPFGFEDLPPEKLKILLNAIFKGDGYIDSVRREKTRPGTRYITIISSVLSLQLRDLLLKIGYEPGIYIQKAKRDSKGVNHRKSFTVVWREDQKIHFSSFLETKDGTKYWLLPIKDIKKYITGEKVYNLTVNKDHSYVANNFVVSNCGKSGSVFNFLMEMERVDFGEALRILAKRAGVRLTTYRPSETEELKEKMYELNHLTAEFYHYLLLNHPVGKKALVYMTGRGTSKESLHLFKVGYAPPLWAGLQKYLIGRKGKRAEDLLKTGLVTRQSRGDVDFFRDRVIFPLQDHRGNYVGFSGRIIGQGNEENSVGPKYINSPETLVYHKGDLLYGLGVTKEAVKKSNSAVIVEGELDLISSFQVGIENVVAIKGSALTEAQVKLLKRFCENLSLSLDTDIAGDMAARRGIEVADAYGLNVRVVRIPEGKDPDELAQKDPVLLRKAIAQAIPVYDFFIESAFSRFNADTPEGKRKIGAELLPVFSKISDEILKSHYVRQLAGKLKVSEEAILGQLEKVEAPRTEKTLESLRTQVKAARSRRDILEEYLLALGLQAEERETIFQAASQGIFKSPPLLRILDCLRTFYKKRKAKKMESERFVQELPSELRETFNNLYLFDLGDKIEDRVWREREVKKATLELEKLTLQEKLKDLSLKMADGEARGEIQILKKLSEEFTKVSRRIVKLSEGKTELGL